MYETNSEIRVNKIIYPVNRFLKGEKKTWVIQYGDIIAENKNLKEAETQFRRKIQETENLPKPLNLNNPDDMEEILIRLASLLQKIDKRSFLESIVQQSL